MRCEMDDRINLVGIQCFSDQIPVACIALYYAAVLAIGPAVSCDAEIGMIYC